MKLVQSNRNTDITQSINIACDNNQESGVCILFKDNGSHHQNQQTKLVRSNSLEEQK